MVSSAMVAEVQTFDELAGRGERIDGDAADDTKMTQANPRHLTN
jgi:hypothetical protein